MRTALIAAALAAGPAGFAQTPERAWDPGKCEEAKKQAHTQKLDGVEPFGGASFTATMHRFIPDGNCLAISFYRLAAKLPPTSTERELRQRQAEFKGRTAPTTFAARYIGDDENAYFRPLWTDQARCSALIPVIENLEKIATPKVTGDGPYRGVATYTTDSPIYELWLQGMVYPQENSGYTMKVTTTSTGKTTALSSWFEETLVALKPCWSGDEPK
jgi:hypothetical protein